MASLVGYLLDTNILVALIRGNKLGKYIDSNYSLSTAFTKSLISIVTVGEMYSLARKFNWGTVKTQELRDLLDELVWLDISDDSTLQAYGDIDAAMEAIGQPMGKNDLWIAASTRATGATLLTTDSDFDRLYPTWIDRIWIDPIHGK